MKKIVLICITALFLLSTSSVFAKKVKFDFKILTPEEKQAKVAEREAKKEAKWQAKYDKASPKQKERMEKRRAKKVARKAARKKTN